MPSFKMTKSVWERIGKEAHWSKAALDSSYVDDPLGDAPPMTDEEVARLVEDIDREKVRAERAQNPLNDRSRDYARRYANKVINDAQKAANRTLFDDDSWQGVNLVFKAMTDAGMDWSLTGAEYQRDDSGNPIRKVWKFFVSYLDKKDKKQGLFGTIIAAGAGSVERPLDKYDVVAYVS